LAQPVPARLTSVGGRRFGLTVGSAFLALAAIAAWRGRHAALLITGTVGTGLVLGALIVPRWLGPVEHGWTALSHALSKVTTPIFLAVVYFIVLTPVGLLMRAFGRRPLTRPRGQASVWIARGSRTRGDMHRQF
jgi:hypothetical protein